jgi:hypothetical protein
MAFADLMKSGLKETPEDEQIRLQQEEAQKVSLFEGWDKTASDDLLFSPPNEAEAPADYARNTLQAYYSKELGVDSLPEMAFQQFIKEDFGTVKPDPILDENKDKNFVKRILDPNQKSLDAGNGQRMTHKMSAEVDEKGVWSVFPTVVEIQGQLKELPLREAQDYAMKSGEFISFGKDKAKALAFAENGYKRGTPMDETGGIDYDLALASLQETKRWGTESPRPDETRTSQARKTDRWRLAPFFQREHY